MIVYMRWAGHECSDGMQAACCHMQPPHLGHCNASGMSTGLRWFYELERARRLRHHHLDRQPSRPALKERTIPYIRIHLRQTQRFVTSGTERLLFAMDATLPLKRYGTHSVAMDASLPPSNCLLSAFSIPTNPNCKPICGEQIVSSTCDVSVNTNSAARAVEDPIRKGEVCIPKPALRARFARAGFRRLDNMPPCVSNACGFESVDVQTMTHREHFSSGF